ncbi:MAG: aspartate-semialdehyde dehydrogenase [Candidatus Ratteibacteria bacterium]|nr:aspartate-semialdehyde dehydrogenase [Candidatus Ratteibacteria bacterium]
MMKKCKVAIVGATGMVGIEMRKILQERKFPVAGLRLLASDRSKGKNLKFAGKDIAVEELKEDSFTGIDIAFFSAGASISRKFAPLAVRAGAVVIDNSSAFRMDKDIPLIVPEVNLHAVKSHQGIIANPNCSTIQLVVVLKPLADYGRIKRIVVSTYQSVSGWGKEAVDQLWRETEKGIQNKKPRVEVADKALPYQIAFNLIPQIDVFLENAYSKEEMKMVNETRKIIEDDSLAITATTVRVPVLVGHTEVVNIESRDKLSAEKTKEILKESPGVTVCDDLSLLEYPMPIKAAGKDDVFVGRIREDESIPNGINLLIVSDNLRKGAALNAIQIAEELIK